MPIGDNLSTFMVMELWPMDSFYDMGILLCDKDVKMPHKRLGDGTHLFGYSGC